MVMVMLLAILTQVSPVEIAIDELGAVAVSISGFELPGAPTRSGPALKSLLLTTGIELTPEAISPLILVRARILFVLKPERPKVCAMYYFHFTTYR